MDDETGENTFLTNTNIKSNPSLNIQSPTQLSSSTPSWKISSAKMPIPEETSEIIPKSNKKIGLLLAVFILLIIITTLVILNKNRFFSIPSKGTNEFLPEKITYSSQPGWTILNTDMGIISAKEEWGLVQIPSAPSLMSNKKMDENYISVQVSKEDTNLSAYDYIAQCEDLYGKPDPNVPKTVNITGNNIPVQVPKILSKQIISINSKTAGACVLSMEGRGYYGKNTNLVSINILANTDGITYHILVTTTDKFYNKNSKDIHNLIASYNP